jgi:hypothetical protein
MAGAATKTGTLALLSVELHDVEEDDDDETTMCNAYVWFPDDLLEKDKHLGATYLDIIDGCQFDDWSTDFEVFYDTLYYEFTGLIETNNLWEHVPFDDPRIQLAYTDPLNKDHSKRYELRPAIDFPLGSKKGKMSVMTKI